MLLQVADQVGLLLQDVVQERLVPAVKKLDMVTWSLALDTVDGGIFSPENVEMVCHVSVRDL